MTPSLRRRALLWSAPIVVIVVVVAVRLLSLGVVNESGQRLLDDCSATAAADRFALLGPLSPVEPWIQPFNTGVARYADDDFAAAESEFRTALDRAPGAATACRVRHNLVISIEGLGDAAADDRELGEARERWREAVELVTDGPCLARDGEIGDRFVEDEDRLRNKLDPDRSGGDGGGTDDGDPRPQPQEPDSETREQLEQLDEQTSDAVEQDRLNETFDRRDNQEPVTGDRW